MKTFIGLLMCLFSLVPAVQGQEAIGYSIENDSIIFRFDVRDYSTYTVANKKRRYYEKEIDIASVAVAGEFNDWSKDEWKLTKKSKYVYQLAKHIDDFKDRYSWDFKYVVNETYWAEPNEYASNVVKSRMKKMFNGNDIMKNLFYVDSKNLRLFTSLPSKSGNTCFKLSGYNDAKRVVLSGSFNYWNEELYVMDKTETGWELTLELRPGSYEYKFIVDGNWIEDPDNPNQVVNEYLSYNSYIDVLAPVTFYLEDHENAQEVYLAGSFNDWGEKDLKMQKQDSIWTLKLNIIGGKHQYKFIVDGQWLCDPKNNLREYDLYGNINSVLMVR